MEAGRRPWKGLSVLLLLVAEVDCWTGLKGMGGRVRCGLAAVHSMAEGSS